jgi:hypothetical protein
MERVVVMPTKERALCVELHGDVTRLITADEPMGVSATKTARATSDEAARCAVGGYGKAPVLTHRVKRVI